MSEMRQQFLERKRISIDFFSCLPRLGASDDQRDLDRLRQEKERSAAQFAARTAVESEQKKQQQKRRAELEMQAELATLL